jgi:hypothetical protein
MLLAALPKICVAKSANQEEDTMKPIWRIFSWSFESLFQGKHPMVNYDGKHFSIQTGAMLSEGSLSKATTFVQPYL